MKPLLAAFVRLVRPALKSRTDLFIENVALRLQARRVQGREAAAQADAIRPSLLGPPAPHLADVVGRADDRPARNRGALAPCRFRLYWRRKSGNGKPGRPRVDSEINGLIHRMASENPGRGSPRIDSELLRLGFDVSERTVARRRGGPDVLKRWMAFLRNHRGGIAAMDFFVVSTATFRVLYVFFVIRHGRCRIAHIAVTEDPKSARIVQQLREAFPFDEAARHLIFDRDAKFSDEVVQTIKAMGIKPARTARKSPWQNGVAERWVLSVRQEMLDCVVVIGEKHLRRLLNTYVAYYHQDRPHLGLDKDTPVPRPVSKKPRGGGTVISLPRVGGLHHRYEWRQAA